ncbi:MAG: hypothetical protein B7Y86_12495 [Brevundimonas subvibrioides]|uniref:Helix-turn-helix domain-containing protein n=1 Tax=Brevundimonas subvibrioides TaxID=74313 RepID=A0A258HHD7_9CAUL|nr:MAG: hypothetical protein B7Y86_12495 [Brevundimonas subvibrioides]
MTTRPQETPLCTKLAARVLGLDHRTLEQWRHLGKGPSYYRLGRQIRYYQADLYAWISGGRVDHQTAS